MKFWIQSDWLLNNISTEYSFIHRPIGLICVNALALEIFCSSQLVYVHLAP